MDVFKISKKSTYIWATFVRKFVTKNFQKSPNLVTLAVSWKMTKDWVAEEQQKFGSKKTFRKRQIDNRQFV